MKPTARLVATLALSIAMLALPTFAADLATWSVAGSTVVVSPNEPGADFQLNVSAPNGDVFSQRFAAGEQPTFQALDDFGQSMGNGSYTFELVATPAPRARDNAASAKVERRVQTYYATMIDGAFVVQVAEEGLNKDQQILDDLIVVGSACVGLDCNNGESFGFDTIRLKENNLRIRAQDTSASASFPTNDWQITFNDTSNGGANKFSIDDIDGGRTPFTIEASAPSHSLYVDDGGRVGLGTATPVVELHVVSGDTPTLRLQQDGSSGFTPQTWDVAGNESGFFVRDATNGSNLAFRIIPGADGQSLVVDSDNNIGVGILNATASVHVSRTDGTGQVYVQNSGSGGGASDLLRLASDGPARFVLENSLASTWQFNSAGDGLRISDTATGAVEMLLASNGNLTIFGSLFTGMGGTCAGGCDRVFHPDFEVESIEEHAALMWENSHLPGVGPTAEDANVINITQKTGGILNELEKAHIYIEQLNDDLKSKDDELDGLKARMAALEQALGLDTAE